ncbi:hypothetical protein WJX73_006773 [Symbiochloris irregularis]|uniref:Uncharacterized protein n=1 Tax=Symbiochloris irregularis TaxID=706552 RepID=A0AAW1PGN0_9CHLO
MVPRSNLHQRTTPSPGDCLRLRVSPLPVVGLLIKSALDATSLSGPIEACEALTRLFSLADWHEPTIQARSRQRSR